MFWVLCAGRYQARLFCQDIRLNYEVTWISSQKYKFNRRIISNADIKRECIFNSEEYPNTSMSTNNCANYRKRSMRILDWSMFALMKVDASMIHSYFSVQMRYSALSIYVSHAHTISGQIKVVYFMFFCFIWMIQRSSLIRCMQLSLICIHVIYSHSLFYDIQINFQ